GDMLRVAIAGEMGPAFPSREVLPRGTGLIGVALREGRPVHAPDVLADDRVTFSPDLRAAIAQAPYRSAVAFPLRVKERVIGGLLVAGTVGWRLDEADWPLAAAFADQSAPIIQNAPPFAEAERRRREAEVLAGLARTLTESLDIAAVGARIVTSVAALLPVLASMLYLREPDGGLRAIALGDVARAHFQPDARLAPGLGVTGRAVAEGRAVSTGDALADPSIALTDDLRQRIERSGLSAFMAVPLRTKGTIVGALSVADRRGGALGAPRGRRSRCWRRSPPTRPWPWRTPACSPRPPSGCGRPRPSWRSARRCRSTSPPRRPCAAWPGRRPKPSGPTWSGRTSSIPARRSCAR